MYFYPLFLHCAWNTDLYHRFYLELLMWRAIQIIMAFKAFYSWKHAIPHTTCLLAIYLGVYCSLFIPFVWIFGGGKIVSSRNFPFSDWKKIFTFEVLQKYTILLWHSMRGHLTKCWCYDSMLRKSEISILDENPRTHVPTILLSFKISLVFIGKLVKLSQIKKFAQYWNKMCKFHIRSKVKA